MSGHSKWSTIKRKKAAADAKRGKVFTKLLREVTVAARLGGGDVAANPRLRAAVQDARANNVPNDNIERAIAKGTGELEGVSLEEVTYEGYGPGGVAVLVEAMTDNRNRTVSEVRHVFNKYGGNLGENGCVAWMFDQRGYFAIEPEAMDEEAFVELALELGVEDLATGDDLYELFTSPADYNATKEALAERGIPVAVGQLSMIPQSTVRVEGDKLRQLLRLLEALEDLDDVQNVWANFDADDQALASQEG
ncbi:MAG: YebC/PmpR family DNA-binding transcriptional regulator [Acidobacteria bacterium]|nr:MAG: YebC/PmpR family DNA-binding transcriptional regulator [Acidobacteriota bacterium]